MTTGLIQSPKDVPITGDAKDRKQQFTEMLRRKYPGHRGHNAVPLPRQDHRLVLQCDCGARLELLMTEWMEMVPAGEIPPGKGF